jgi:hypothetical protein
MGCGTPWIWRGTPRIVHFLRKTTSHATSPPLRFGSVTGCRPIKSKISTISCVSKLPPKWREFYFLHVPSSKPCNLASAPLRLGHGLSPYKKAKKQIFLRERAPDEICFYLFCMACSFREKSACIMEKGMVD